MYEVYDGVAYCEHGYCTLCPHCQLNDRVRKWNHRFNRYICSIVDHRWNFRELLKDEDKPDILFHECRRCSEHKYRYEDGSIPEHGIVVHRWLIHDTDIFGSIPKIPWSREAWMIKN